MNIRPIRSMKIRVRWGALAAQLGLGAVLALLLVWALGCSGVPASADEPAPVPTQLPACPTEDSDDCYWDAQTMGNGQGEDSVVLTPEPTPTLEASAAPVQVNEDPAPAAELATEPAPWLPPCTDSVAEAGGMCAGPLVDWPFSTGETLVCGHDAKPALDYREDVGWWAYCEPALAD